MNNYEFTCIPNGHFDFDDFFKMNLIKMAISEIKSKPASSKDKLKTLVSYMQYVDLVAEISYRRQEDMTLNGAWHSIAMELSKHHVMNNFDEVMKNFSTQQHDILRKAVS
ncbi:hypothetical protein [Chromobacterium violaceum]|uniref:hypothetical protein n=1 Tax=Chromobacterium violaceum TaxID=536 RepID=UPI00111C236E|nr:hypothetical protein [Chromobacterium violaceum]